MLALVFPDELKLTCLPSCPRNRCTCKHCAPLPTAQERKCSREFPAAISLQPVGCFTDNENFENVCLSRVVLDIVYWDARDLGERVDQAEYRYVNLLMRAHRIFRPVFGADHTSRFLLCNIFIEEFPPAAQALDS